MKARIEPCAIVLSLASKIDEISRQHLGEDLEKVGGDFAYIPNRLQYIYELKSGHLIRVTVEEYV